MTKFNCSFLSALFLFGGVAFAQEGATKEREPGHVNQSKFKQMYEEFATPNNYRSASGAPGPDYYQQQADYVMNIELDDKNHWIYGEETITYTNNSPGISLASIGSEYQDKGFKGTFKERFQDQGQL